MKNSQNKRPQTRHRIIVEGIVQGVGFRPFVFQLAKRLQVSGWVRNDSTGVTIEAEATADTLDLFVRCLQVEKPPLAEITSLEIIQIQVLDEEKFTICQSLIDKVCRVQIAPDTFVCTECLEELFDPTDRRYRYPFINCTNCGPRFTIVTGTPYDRSLTTMVNFPMCDLCRAEYENPLSRRFHAQPNACPDCGPQLELNDLNGVTVRTDNPLDSTIAALQKGQIVAVKGLGGYHLAVDAANSLAVQELRRRKCRDEKPFALMVRDLESALAIAEISETEAKLLTGPERPIVLLTKKKNHPLAEGIAPNNRYFGIMLPYTPLHHLILSGNFFGLIMTSANISDEPIVYKDNDVHKRLFGIADLYLKHNRRIENRTDDSIVRVILQETTVLRRARGFVPRAVTLPCKLPNILAVGAELKNTICLTRADQAYLSQHIGDLKNLEVYESFKRTLEHMTKLIEVCPEQIAHDLHPDYYSTHYALEESNLPKVAVQHHHAHLASCLAEHGRQHPAIGVIFDGTGFGEDGHFWGGEFLIGDFRTYERSGHFRYQSMPGGDLAIREPWRMALSYLQSVFGDIPPTSCILKGLRESEWRLVAQANQKGINAPLTSSCGRLFDAVAALLGVRQTVSFEGQAAMELEMLSDPNQINPFPYNLAINQEQIEVDSTELIRALFEAHQSGSPVAQISGRFHATLASLICDVCDQLQSQSGLRTVVLSGGVFQNVLLTRMSKERLEGAGFEVLIHSRVPPNDGGLALGQAVVAGYLS